MGIVRGGLLFFVVILFLISLIVGNLFLTMDVSLGYENVKPELIDVAKKNININYNQDILKMQTYCQSNSEYVLNSGLYDSGFVSIPCDVIISGENSVLDFVVGKYVEEKYYKEYNCNLLDCPFEGIAPLVYVSQHAKNYWKQLFYYSLFASLILFVLMFLLIEKKKSIFTDTGVLIVISSLPLLGINWVVSSFNFGDVLFSKAKFVFLAVFITGAVLFVVGVIFNFWKFRDSDKETSKEEVKEIVKEEVSKVKENISKSKKK